MLEVNNLFHATRIIEGYGVIETTGQECANLGFGKVLVITDPFLASSEHYKKLKKSLDDAKIENFLLTNVKPNPRAEDCDEMAEFAKKNHVDALIALGGGSAMDQAKAVGAVVTNGKSTVEWGDTELDTNILPLICIPSTSGTGAEVTWCAVITDTERQYKMTVGDPVHMIPVLAICDPEITIGLPKSLTAACGVDALTHCIVRMVQLHQPITELCRKGFYDRRNLGTKRRQRSEETMIASTIGGMAFISSNVGAVHAFAETVGAWFDTPHGVANSLFLPYIMEFNIPACPERFADIADAMGIEREESMSDEQYALKAVEYVKALNRKLNIPTIKEIKGITEERFEAIAERSANNVLSNDNARKITKEDYLELLKKAYNE
ncbi:MAG: iron-containing alcohol dehydrogenase [[Ruminococcus] torques]